MCVYTQRPSALWKAVISLLHSLLRKIRKLFIVLWGSINTIWDKRLVCKQLWGWRRQCPERGDPMGSAKAKVGSWGGWAVWSLAADNSLLPNQPFRTVSYVAGSMAPRFTRIQDKAQSKEQQLMMGSTNVYQSPISFQHCVSYLWAAGKTISKAAIAFYFWAYIQADSGCWSPSQLLSSMALPFVNYPLFIASYSLMETWP